MKKEKIIIKGDFEVIWEEKMSNVKPPLEYFEIELFYPPMYKVNKIRSKTQK